MEEVSVYYQNRGCFNELISLMESGLGLERAHMGIFTELGVLYARYRPEKLMEHIKLFSTRLNIPKLIRACDEQQHWKELTYLYIQYDEFDNAATTIMNHSPDAWDHMQFKDVSVKVANVELYYKAVHFYLQEHPDLINDLLNVLALRVDHTRVVDIMRKVFVYAGSCFFFSFFLQNSGTCFLTQVLEAYILFWLCLFCWIPGRLPSSCEAIYGCGSEQQCLCCE